MILFYVGRKFGVRKVFRCEILFVCKEGRELEIMRNFIVFV